MAGSPYTAKSSSALMRDRFFALALSGVTVAALIYLWLFDPASSVFYPPCLFHALTGLHCPGCGTTRALHQLMHGDVAAAFKLNPLTMLLLPFMAYACLSYVIGGIRGRGLPRLNVPPRTIHVLLVMVIVFWILRNIPFYSFSLLAP